MSAFQVSNAHISAIVTYGVAAGLVSDIAKAGEMLTLANHLSVVARYRDNGPAPVFTFTPAKIVTAVQCVKLCNCFHYQACEVDGYAGSLSSKLVDSIRAAAIAFSGFEGEAHKMPGYEEAAWSI